jgi:hypothetical protein
MSSRQKLCGFPELSVIFWNFLQFFDESQNFAFCDYFNVLFTLFAGKSVSKDQLCFTKDFKTYKLYFFLIKLTLFLEFNFTMFLL